MEIWMHYIWQPHAQGQLVPVFVPLVDQQVDIFTKYLLEPTFTNLMACISIGAFPLRGENMMY
jgi:hypothetical protein